MNIQRLAVDPGPNSSWFLLAEFLKRSGEPVCELSVQDPQRGGKTRPDWTRLDPEGLFRQLCQLCQCVVALPQDLSFILKGLARLLNNPLVQTYLPNSSKKIHFDQELLILFWKFCDFNKVSSSHTQGLWEISLS